MHARGDEIVTELPEHTGLHAPVCIERRDEIGKHAVEVG